MLVLANNFSSKCCSRNEGELQESLKNEDKKSNKENLTSCYFKIYNIFSECTYQGIPQWCKGLSPYTQLSRTYRLYDNPRGRNYTSIQFDANHKIVDSASYFTKGYPNTLEINKFIVILVERFAQELKLVGSHRINVNFYRTKYTSQAKDMEEFQLDWHFDQFAKSSMVAVFQNDFPYKEGEIAGLDIAENQASGPYEPLASHSNAYLPKNGYTSCSFPPNGAIIFQSKQGAIIHRRSILAKPDLPDATRSVIQIKLKDIDWPKVWK